ncbi:hypothetical protein QJR36_12220 [Paraclostridium sordellii]|uniref:CHASE3 domain-containing protein n=1 Tax=Paraclostridium sordellii TaxID=1505 RepID=UPI0030CE4EC3
MKDLKIGRKLSIAFAILLMLTAFTSFTLYLNLDSLKSYLINYLLDHTSQQLRLWGFVEI